jgi:hypothetical protein
MDRETRVQPPPVWKDPLVTCTAILVEYLGRCGLSFRSHSETHFICRKMEAEPGGVPLAGLGLPAVLYV